MSNTRRVKIETCVTIIWDYLSTDSGFLERPNNSDCFNFDIHVFILFKIKKNNFKKLFFVLLDMIVKPENDQFFYMILGNKSFWQSSNFKTSSGRVRFFEISSINCVDLSKIIHRLHKDSCFYNLKILNSSNFKFEGHYR